MIKYAAACFVSFNAAKAINIHNKSNAYSTDGTVREKGRLYNRARYCIQGALKNREMWTLLHLIGAKGAKSPAWPAGFLQLFAEAVQRTFRLHRPNKGGHHPRSPETISIGVHFEAVPPSNHAFEPRMAGFFDLNRPSTIVSPGGCRYFRWGKGREPAS